MAKNYQHKLSDVVLALDFLVGMGSGYMRGKGADLLVLAGMYGSDAANRITLAEITDRINAELMEPLEIRRQLVQESLKRLNENDLIEHKKLGDIDYYWHTEDSKQLISRETQKKTELFEKSIQKIVTKVREQYPLFPNQLESTVGELFKHFVCELFEKFGHQTATMITGRFSAKDFVISTEVERIIRSLVHTHRIKQKELILAIEQVFVSFLTERDPEMESLKFYLAQNYYLLKLLGVDPNTPYLAQEAFKDAVLILDSNVVITSLLCESRPYQAFQEFAKVSKTLQIKTVITNFTVQEIENVVSYEKWKSRLYQVVPEHMAGLIRGSFFRTYVERKKADSSFGTNDLFEPFERIPASLEDEFNIQFMNAQKAFDLSYDEKHFLQIKKVIDEQSIEVRNRAKTPKSVEHDAIHYVVVLHKRQKQSKTWFLTLDTSLPFASEKLIGKEHSPFCFTLDSWLECLSPFITTEASKAKFSFIFSNVFSSVLFPLQEVYDVSDFEVFDDMHVSAAQLPPEVAKQTVSFFKNRILKGSPYDPRNREKYAFELRKFFRSIERKYSDNQQYLETIKQQGEQIEQFFGKLQELAIDQDKTKTELKNLKEKVAKIPQKDAYIVQANWGICGLITILIGLIGVLLVYPAFQRMSVYEKLSSSMLLLGGLFFAFSFPFGHNRTWRITSRYVLPLIGLASGLYAFLT